MRLYNLGLGLVAFTGVDNDYNGCACYIERVSRWIVDDNCCIKQAEVLHLCNSSILGTSDMDTRDVKKAEELLAKIGFTEMPEHVEIIHIHGYVPKA